MSKYTEGWLRQLAQENPDLLRENPDLLVGTSASPTPAKDSEKDKLKDEFEMLWRHIDGPALDQEYTFHPGRKWRFDYAHPDAKVAIELEGGVWSNGRHVRGQGFIDDAEKYNSAALHGWTVFRLATGMVTMEWVEAIADYIEGMDW
jgi:very-short-patch-repair endonuclease